MLNSFQHPPHHTGMLAFNHRTPASVYIFASDRNGTIYIGVTSDLMKRIYKYRSGEVVGFTSKYGVKNLVHYELFADMLSAIAREKQLKN